MRNKRLNGFMLTTAFLLSIPAVAMPFTDEVNWTISDFIAAGILPLGTELLCELVVRKVSKTQYRVVLCAALLGVLLLTWLELAVGIFGTPFAGQ